MFAHQVLVVGGGLAGMRAAIEAKDLGADVALLSLVHPLRSHSGAAQGGINGPLGNNPQGRDDNPEKQALDTVKGSDYLADQVAVEALCAEAAERIYEMEHWGCPFSRTPEGKIAQRPFGGADFPRTCYAADKTGHYLLHTLYEQVLKRGIKVYAEWALLSLAQRDGAVAGVVALHLPTGEVASFPASAVIFTTGGAGRLYSKSTNALINTGASLGVAFRSGVPLKDMEFIQFHPTSLYPTNILISEAARGEGGYLYNSQWQRFMSNYASKAMELAPRDIVSRSIHTEIMSGRGFEGGYVLLDLRHLGREKILERLPGIREIAIHFAGVDPIEQPIPVVPAQHYTMGGIDTNIWGETILPGFYAAGECACVSVHGANRLGGNSLLETLVFGRRAGARAAEAVRGNGRPDPEAVIPSLRQAQAHLEELGRGRGKADPAPLRQALGEVMMEKVGIFRHKADLAQGVEALKGLAEQMAHTRPTSPTRRFNWDLVRTYELEAQLLVAQVVAQGALLREESRGSHYRTDFPQRDDTAWLKHTLAHPTPPGTRFSFSPVLITRWQPEARKY